MGAWAKALGRRGDFAFLGASGYAESALEAVAYTHVDLVLTDWHLLDMDGGKLTTRIKQCSPATRVLLTTGNLDPDITRRALAAGVDGVLHKPFVLDGLSNCVHTVLAGHRVLSDRATGHLLTPPPAAATGPTAAQTALALLSPTERKVMAHLVSGLCLKAAADRSGMSLHTADTHRRRAYRKLGVHTLAEATRQLTGAQLGS